MVGRSEAVAAPALDRRSVTSSVAWTSPGVLVALTTMALVVLGLIMILSASSISAFAAYGSSFMFFKKQLLWAALGVVMFTICAKLDYRRLRGTGYLAYVAAVGLLVAVLVPGIGVTIGGSARWIAVGSFSFQPAEVAKLALILFAADVLSRKEERTLREFSHTLFPVIPAFGVMALLILMQPDLGTAIILAVVGMGVVFVAGAPIRNLVPIAAVGSVVGVAAAFGEDYRRARMLAFLDPWADPLNTGYQTIQSLIALGSGGLFGVGLGASRQKWSYIPNAHTDFIYAILGEEMGLVGSLAVLGLFVFLTYLGIRIARNARDRFGMLLAAGITIWVSFQAFVNMGAVTATMPITGVPLPLVSFGGSSLVILLAAMGILVSIARRAREEKR